MPSPGLTTTWGQEVWSPILIEALSTESALLRAGARRIVGDGRTIHVPRLLVAPDADWVGELEELPSDAGDADTIVLEPKKIGNVIGLSTESIEDASVDELDAVGRAMVRGVAAKVDARFFSASAATALAPAGLLAGTLPGVTGDVTVETITTGVGAIEAEGGQANAAFVNAADLTAIRLAVLAGGYSISDPSSPGVQAVAGARLIPAPLPAGTAVIADTRFIVVGVRRDAAVDFSTDAMFTKDAVAARVTMRVDWEAADPAAFYVIA